MSFRGPGRAYKMAPPQRGDFHAAADRENAGMNPTDPNQNRLIARQIRRNADSRDHWDLACLHRHKVTQLITDGVTSRDARLCILGAGNCNDVDLPGLAQHFAEIHLVDLDAQSLQAAIVKQSMGKDSSIQLHGDCDLTGVLNALANWSIDTSPAETEFQRVFEQASSFAGPRIPGPFDVVASVCLLSQLTEAVTVALDENHPRFHELLQSIRHRHLRLLVEMTKPGGIGIMVMDFVSSDSAPQLSNVAEDQLPFVLSKMIDDRNFFHGLNPAVVASLFQNDPRIAPLVETLDMPKPWLWDFGVRHYAVTSFKFRRKET